VTGVQTCALPISRRRSGLRRFEEGTVRALLELFRRRARRARRTRGEPGLCPSSTARRRGEGARAGAAGLEAGEGCQRTGVIGGTPVFCLRVLKGSNTRPSPMNLPPDPFPDPFPPQNPDEHPTSNIQHRTSNGSANHRSLRRSVFDVGYSMFPSAQEFDANRFIFAGAPETTGKASGCCTSPSRNRAALRDRRSVPHPCSQIFSGLPPCAEILPLSPLDPWRRETPKHRGTSSPPFFSDRPATARWDRRLRK